MAETLDPKREEYNHPVIVDAKQLAAEIRTARTQLPGDVAGNLAHKYFQQEFNALNLRGRFAIACLPKG